MAQYWNAVGGCLLVLAVGCSQATEELRSYSEGTDGSAAIDLIALDDALQQFEAKNPHKAELVKLRFFAGLTNEQAASALGISSSTADNYWAYARSWLRLAMSESDGEMAE